jgi:transposase
LPFRGQGLFDTAEVGPVFEGIGRGGGPKVVRAGAPQDGPCYRSREFARTLAAADVAHRRTRPYRPQTNGKVERFNLTLKWELAYARPYDSNESRTNELQRWLHAYNYHRPHMAHAGRPPSRS